MYDTPRPDEIMMDMDVEYFGDLDVGISLMKVIIQTNFKLRFHSQLQVTFSMLKISASVSDVQFEAKVRVILKPLVGLIPIVGGVQESEIFLYSSRMIMNS